MSKGREHLLPERGWGMSPRPRPGRVSWGPAALQTRLAVEHPASPAPSRWGHWDLALGQPWPWPGRDLMLVLWDSTAASQSLKFIC